MSDCSKPWTLHASALQKARRDFRRAEPEGLHDIRVALRRIGATAAALGRKKLAARSKALVQRLSGRRQLEVDRELLGRVTAAGALSRETAAVLDSRWETLLRAREREAERVAYGKKMRRLARRLSRLSRSPKGRALTKLEEAWRDARKALALAPDVGSDRALHRYRLAVKRARYLAEDLMECGATGLADEVARAKAAQTALGRWNDIRLFCKRLEKARERAERAGAVSLSAEISSLLSVLNGTTAAARKVAVQASRQFSNVIPLLGRRGEENPIPVATASRPT